MSLPALFRKPACWWDQRSLMRLADCFHADKPGEVVVELRGYTIETDRLATTICHGALTNQATPELRLHLLRAVAERHSGSCEEGEKIVSAILHALSVDIPPMSDMEASQ